MKHKSDFVTWFRSVAPYVNTFRGKTFVIALSGEVVADGNFIELVHDFNLLASLGIRLVLVHSTRPQLESAKSLQVIDCATLAQLKESVGRVHIEIEALLSMGLPNSPMANASIRVSCGNFVTACPIGIVDGIDLMYTGKVRKINSAAIRSHLDLGEVVLISPLGYSPTGEIFSLTLENVATEVAVALNAEKLIFLIDDTDEQAEKLPRELTVAQGKAILKKIKRQSTNYSAEIKRYLPHAIKSCELGVTRTHLINRHIDGVILQELFTHDGVGSMISQQPLQTLRVAKIEDIGSILQLIEPLEANGTLVRRHRELLEIEIGRFCVSEHDGMIIGCAALYPFPEENACELACLAVNPNYHNAGHGAVLLKYIEAETINQGIKKLFVLTTRATHWFIEHGFKEATPADLPGAKKGRYNYQRRSKVLMKKL